MKSFLKALLSDSGAISMVRLMSLAALVVGSVVALYGVYTGKDLAGVTQIVGIFVGSAFGGKCAQKYLEMK